jgi:hypothetical protein
MPWNTKNVRLFVSPLVQHFWAIFQGIPSIHRLIASPILPNRYGTKMNKKQNHPNAVVFVSCDTFPAIPMNSNNLTIFWPDVSRPWP